jgi:cytochrome d ubiquinol oxidase subunit II
MWDVFFFGGSLVISLAVGISLGNLIEGIPLNENHEYVGNMVMTFLRPYPILVGILTVALFMMHGTVFLIMKTEDALQEKLKSWLTPCMIFFIIAYAVTTLVTLIYQEHMVMRIRERPYLFLIALANMLIIAAIPHEVYKKRYGWTFILSCLNIAFLMSLFAIGTFPDVVRSSVNPKVNSITVTSAAASMETLVVLSIIVGIGLPLVFLYGIYIYHLFRGKVRKDKIVY